MSLTDEELRGLVLYQDDRILAVNKPPGIHVHRSMYDRDEPSLAEGLERALGVKLFPVHRLDRPTSGVLIFALDHEAASFLSAAFRDRLVEKTYWALVRGWMPEARAVFPVQLDVKDPRRTDAETQFRPLEWYELPWAQRGFSTFRMSLVEAKPLTGRRHQIRQHCDDLRHPILGDTVWGDTALNGWLAGQLATVGFALGGLQLWCRNLEFPHPSGGSRSISAPLGPEAQARLDWYRGFCAAPTEPPAN